MRLVLVVVVVVAGQEMAEHLGTERERERERLGCTQEGSYKLSF